MLYQLNAWKEGEDESTPSVCACISNKTSRPTLFAQLPETLSQPKFMHLYQNNLEIIIHMW